MKLVKTKGKDPTYYGQVGVRIGKKTTTHNEKYFGKHSELLKEHPDPEAYVRAQIAQWNAEHKRRDTADFRINYDDKIDYVDNEEGESTALNIGYFYIQDILKDLQLKKYMDKNYSDYEFEYNAYDILRFLIYDRILYPESKLAFSKRLSTFYEQPDFQYHDILRFMDVLVDKNNEKTLLEWCYKKSTNIVSRDLTVVYCDCTNFYCETEHADPTTVIPDTGEIIEGLRRFGISKEHRPNPQVEVGLFTDGSGIPLSYCVEPGNTAECTTVIPLENEICRMLQDEADFIYCADSSLGTYSIRKFNSMGGRKFVVTQSIKELKKPLQDAVFNDYDYRLLSSDKPIKIKTLENLNHDSEGYDELYDDIAYKVIPADNVCDLGAYDIQTDENGNYMKDSNGEYILIKKKELIKQYLIITYSKKLRDYQRSVREGQIERAQQLIKNSKNPLDIKKSANDAKRFIRTVTTNKKGEKTVTKCEIDWKRISEEEKYDGYYCIATNLDCSGKLAPITARKALDISKGRNRIEYCFRMMKSNFNTRPIFHHKKERIRAHILICFLALLVERLLEAKLDEMNCHATTGKLIAAMEVMKVNEDKGNYTSIFKGGRIMQSLEKMSGLQLDHKYYRCAELNRRIRHLLT